MRPILLSPVFAVLVFAQGMDLTPLQVIDARGGQVLPCASCSIYTYAAGTSTPLATYADYALQTANTNPVLTNSAGYAVNGSALTGIRLGSQCYKFVLKDASGLIVRTQDHICDAAQVQNALFAPSGESVLTGFSHSEIYPAGTVGSKLKQFVSVTDAPYGARCDGSTDDAAALQSALNSGALVFIPHSSGACMTSVSLTTAMEGQIITGSGSGSSGGRLTPGQSAIKALGSITGPLLIVKHFGVKISDIELDGNRAATNGLYLACAADSVFSRLRVHSATGAGIYVGPSEGGSYSCATSSSPENDLIGWYNVDSDRNGGGGFVTGLTTLANQNTMINNNFVSNKGVGMLLRGVTSWHIITGIYADNSSYGIQYSLAGDSASVASVQLFQPDVESNNIISAGPPVVLGPQAQFGPITSENLIIVDCGGAFPDGDFSGADVQECIDDGGITISGAPNEGPASPSFAVKQRGVGTVFSINSDKAGSMTEKALANVNFPGIVESDASGNLSTISNTQSSVCAIQTASFTVPRNCVHVPMDTTGASGGFDVHLSASPLSGETHTLTMAGFGPGHFATLDGNGKYINLSSGSVTIAVNFFTEVNQSLTVRYNGISWDVLSDYSGAAHTAACSGGQHLTSVSISASGVLSVGCN